MIKNAKLAKLNTKIANAFLNIQTSIYDLIECKYLCCNKNYQKSLMKS